MGCHLFTASSFGRGNDAMSTEWWPFCIPEKWLHRVARLVCICLLRIVLIFRLPCLELLMRLVFVWHSRFFTSKSAARCYRVPFLCVAASSQMFQGVFGAMSFFLFPSALIPRNESDTARFDCGRDFWGVQVLWFGFFQAAQAWSGLRSRKLQRLVTVCTVFSVGELVCPVESLSYIGMFRVVLPTWFNQRGPGSRIALSLPVAYIALYMFFCEQYLHFSVFLWWVLSWYVLTDKRGKYRRYTRIFHFSAVMFLYSFQR